MSASNADRMGVVIVTFNSRDVIASCLDSLIASNNVGLDIVVVDNASTDGTIDHIREWARQRTVTDESFVLAERGVGEHGPVSSPLTLVLSPVNGGYAHGVNLGLEVLLEDPDSRLFWVLNPDCEVAPHTAGRYVEAGADGNFALMSGRTLSQEMPDLILTDGGRVNRWTGVCTSRNAGAQASETPMADVAACNYLTGANLVASRKFIEAAGLMEESYFLYYEEVDWAFRRGSLPLRIIADAPVYHHGGTAIGSGTIDRRASAFSNYFNYRSRVRFMRRHRPAAFLLAVLYALAKAGQLALRGDWAEAEAIARGTLGFTPPRRVRDRIAPGKARRLAFG